MRCSNRFVSDERISVPWEYSHEGGRLVQIGEDRILLSVGDYGFGYEAQNPASILGKIVEIEEGNSFTVFASGVRNPQGLAYDPSTDIVWESEHGPAEGDEVNIIKKGGNYGWPLVSAGLDDRYGLNIAPITSYLKNIDHAASGFNAPLWTTQFHIEPGNIGPSQVVVIPASSQLPVKGSILVTSLSGGQSGPSNYTGYTIYRFTSQGDSEPDKLFIGDRMRDAIYSTREDSIYLVLENQRKLARLSGYVN